MAKNALAELGMVSDPVPSETRDADTDDRTDGHLYAVVDNEKDYFVEKDGVKFAGTHLLIELWGASRLNDPAAIEEALCDGARAAGATILYTHFHHFQPNEGVSGVVVLAESHISIHTWPERDYAAVDIFMCGDCNPYDALPVLKERFTPDTVQLAEQRRGLVP